MNDTAIPLPWQIVVAHTLLDSKPEGVSLNAYLLALRGSITVASGASDDKYIDHEKLWRCLVLETLQERQDLINQISELMLENHRLKGNESITPCSKKRKAITQAHSYMETSKRAKSKHNDQIIIDDLDSLEDATYGSKIAGCLLQAQKQLLAEPQNTRRAADCLSRGFELLTKAFNNTFGIHRHHFLTESVSTASTSTPHQDPSAISRSIVRATTILMGELSQLRIDPEKEIHIALEVVSACVALLDQVLDTISLHAHESCLRATNTLSTRTRAALSNRADTLLSMLVDLILNILAGLDATLPFHLQLFDGVFHIVLQRCGRLIYILQFGHVHCTNISDEIAADQDTCMLGQSNIELEKPATEARYLLRIVRRMVRMAPKFTVPPSSGSHLSASAKELLEHTLVDAIWDEQFNPVAAKLNKPLQSTRPPPDATDASNPTDFIDKMWELVGWDILGKDIDDDSTEDEL